MPVTVGDFLKALSETGIIPLAEAAALEQHLPAGQRGLDAQPLAAELVRLQRLTKFQAAMLYQGKGRTLLLGSFLLLDKLGQGRAGVVYKACHRQTNRIVALKVLLESVTKDPAAVERLKRDVQAAKQLVHPHIVTIHGLSEAQAHHIVIMEFIEGQDLGSLLKKEGPLPVDRAIDCLFQAAQGLEFAHAKGVIHGGIKPSNLLLSRDGLLKIGEVGLTWLDGPQSSAANERGDIRSLGCTLFTLLTGEAMAPGSAVRSLRARHGDVPGKLEAIFRRMVAAKPEQGYRSVTEAIADIEPLASSYRPAEPEVTLEGPDDVVSRMAQNISIPADLLREALAPKPVTASALSNDTARQSEPTRDPRRYRSTPYVMPRIQLFSVLALVVGVFSVFGIGGWLMYGQGEKLASNNAQQSTPSSQPAEKKAEPKAEAPKAKPPKKEPEPKSEPPKAEPRKSEPNDKLPASADADRRFAEWFVETCGRAGAKSLDGTKFFSLARRADIPREDFRITFIEVTGMPDDPQKFAELKTLARLEGILAQGVPVDDDFVLFLKDAPSVKSISINRSQITDKALEHFKEVRNLAGISLQGNAKITRAGYEHLSALSNLGGLVITMQDSLDDAALMHVARLSKLQSLFVQSPNITNAGLEHLITLRALSAFEIASPKVTDDGLKHLAALSALKRLIIRECTIQGPGLAHVAKHDLNSFSVSDSSMADDDLRHIAGMKNLNTLTLMRSANITDDGLRHLSDLAQLAYLELIYCPKIKGPGLRHLAKLKSLQRLTLNGTKVAPLALSELRKAIPKCKVQVD